MSGKRGVTARVYHYLHKHRDRQSETIETTIGTIANKVECEYPQARAALLDLQKARLIAYSSKGRKGIIVRFI